MQLHIKDLTAFITICEEGSFTKASERLYISQPSLSKIVKDLEIKTNSLLLERTSRKLNITDAGYILLSRGKEIIKMTNRMDAEIRDLADEISGEINLGLPQIIGTVFFSNIAKEFLEEYPKVNLKIKEAGGLIVESLIEEGSLDLGLCVLPTLNKNLSSEMIFEDSFIICVPKNHRFANYREVSIEELQNEEFIMFDKSFQLNRIVMEACRDAGFLPKVTFESTQWDFIMELVSSNMGISIVPKILYKKLNDIDVVPIKIKDTKLSWKIGIVTKEGTYKSNALKKIIEVIHKKYV